MFNDTLLMIHRYIGLRSGSGGFRAEAERHQGLELAELGVLNLGLGFRV